MLPTGLSDSEARNHLRAVMGDVARRAREPQGMTQDDVGELLGLNSELYARVERGLALPSLTTMCGMLAILRLGADALLGRTPYPRALLPAPGDSGEELPPRAWWRLMRRLRRAQPSALRMVRWLLHELDKVEKRGRGQAR